MTDPQARAEQPVAGERDASFSLADALYLIFRHGWVALGGLLLGLAAALALFLLTPAVFRAEAKLLVRYVADTTLLDPGAAQGRVVIPDMRGENIINSEIEIFANRESVEEVVNRIGPARFDARATNGLDRSRAIRSLLDNLHVEAPRRSNIIKVYYDGPTPELSLQVLTQLVDAYLDKHLRVHRSAAAFDFLSQQTDQNRAHLAETEEELRKLKNEAGVLSVREAQNSLMARGEELRRLTGETEAELAGMRARLAVIGPTLQSPTPPPVVVANTTRVARAGGPRDRLSRLEQREMELLNTYTEDSTPVQQLRAQIAEVRRLIADEPAAQPVIVAVVSNTPAFVPESAEVAALEARLQTLRSQQTQTVAEARRLDQLEGRILQLERNRQIQDDNYRSFSRSLEQARINDALDSAKISNISVVQPATLVATNHRPGLIRQMGMALSGGVLCGLIAIAGIEWLPGRRVRRQRDVEAGLGLPSMLSVPRVRTARHDTEATAAATTPAPLPLMTSLQPYCDALGDRLLRTLGPALPNPCLIGLAGCRTGVGVTTLAAGLAVTLARHHQTRVLLLEPEPGADGPRRLAGVPSSRCALDISTNAQGQITVIEHNLFLLGPAPEASQLAGHLVRRWPDLLLQAQADGYRFVVVDLPPLSPVSSALRLVSALHATVLVVEADHDRWTSVEDAHELLVRSRAPLIGTVLNKVKHESPHWPMAGHR